MNTGFLSRLPKQNTMNVFPNQPSDEEITAIIRRHADELRKKGATGISIGLKEKDGQIVEPFQRCIIIQVRDKRTMAGLPGRSRGPADPNFIPTKIENVLTDICGGRVVLC